MKKHSHIFSFVVLLMFIGLATSVNAQRIVNVEQGVGTLNEAIDSDTTASGDRVDESTIYVLEKGGYYLTTGSISNRGWTLRIQAADGEGDRPIIQPALIEGGESTYPFRPRGDFYISGLYITNMDQGGGLIQRPIRASADSVKLVIDNCHIDFAGQAAIRIDDNWNDIIITNSIISNMGRMSSPANGRGVDDRGSDIDTLIMRNNTIYNTTMTVLRDGGGIINYADVDHNTIVNVGQFGIHFGEVVEVHFTNNLMINPGFLGETGDETRSSVIVDALGDDLVGQGVQQIVDLDYNNFYIDPALIEAHPDSVNAVPLFDSTTTALMEAAGTGTHNISEAVDFTSGPESPVSVITSFYNNSISLEEKENMDDGGGGPIPNQGVPVQSPFDFSYSTSLQSATASSTGEQLGSLTWFGITVGVERDPNEIPTNFELSNNYPNPFNPTTTIKYAIPAAANVKLVVYNMLGEVVKTLVNQSQVTGSYSVTWDGTTNFGTQVASGIYIYRLTAGEFVSNKKMILMK